MKKSVIEKEKVLIVWSGGFDSTALVLKACKEGIDFDTVYFDLGNNPVKSKLEQSARNKISNFLQEQYSYWKDEIIEINKIDRGHLSYPQPFFWITSLVSQVQLNKYKEIWLGYVSGDGITALKTEFIVAFKNLALISQCGMVDEKNIPDLVFPFLFSEKKELLRLYEDCKISNLIKHIHFCENQEEVICLEKSEAYHKCDPCTKFESTFSKELFYPYRQPNLLNSGGLTRNLVLKPRFTLDLKLFFHNSKDINLFNTLTRSAYAYTFNSLKDKVSNTLSFFVEAQDKNSPKDSLESFSESLGKMLDFMSLQQFDTEFVFVESDTKDSILLKATEGEIDLPYINIENM